MTQKIDFSSLPLTLGIIGSRSFDDDVQASSRMLTEVFRFVESCNKETVIVSGGAKGIDSLAARAAHFYQLPLPVIYRPNRAFPYPARFFARNTEIVEHVKSAHGALVAFLDEHSHRGSDDTIRKAVQAGLACHVFVYSSQGKFLKHLCK